MNEANTAGAIADHRYTALELLNETPLAWTYREDKERYVRSIPHPYYLVKVGASWTEDGVWNVVWGTEEPPVGAEFLSQKWTSAHVAMAAIDDWLDKNIEAGS